MKSKLLYYAEYLYQVSPPEGTILLQVKGILDRMGNLPCSTTLVDALSEEDIKSDDEDECIMCRFQVPGTRLYRQQKIVIFHFHIGHIHPGKSSHNLQLSQLVLLENTYFGTVGGPRSPIFCALAALPRILQKIWNDFPHKLSLQGLLPPKSRALSSRDLFETLGVRSTSPTSRSRSSSSSSKSPSSSKGFGSMAGSPPKLHPKSLLETANALFDQTMLSRNSLLELHSCLDLPESIRGTFRNTAAVGWASSRIYRSFLPAAEIPHALELAFDTLETLSNPWIASYYIFSALVFYIHPFQDGNGRIARLVTNRYAKMNELPTLLASSDKTIQFEEVLHARVSSRQPTRSCHQQQSMWF